MSSRKASRKLPGFLDFMAAKDNEFNVKLGENRQVFWISWQVVLKT